MSDELTDIFVAEGRELVDQATVALAALRGGGHDGPALEQLFRAFHTLKGSAGLMAFSAMAQVFHAGEDRLSEARDAAAGLDGALADALVAVLDRTEGWLAETEAAGRLPDPDAASVADLIRQLGGQADDAVPRSNAAPQADPPPDLRPGAYVSVRYTPPADAFFRGEDPLALMAAIPDLARLDLAPRAPFGDLAAYDPFACNLVLTALSRAPQAAVGEALCLALGEVDIGAINVADPADAAPAEGAAAARSLRVEAARLDDLAAAADELAVLKNRLAQLTAEAARAAPPALGRELAKAQAELDRQVLRVHGAVTRLRVTPLGPVFRRFPRLVRETAATLGKDVELGLSGVDVEVDKTIVDGLFEPLLHLVRNALDHGIEPPAARREAGKPASGRLSLTARTAGEQVVIEVADDGRGVDAAAVRRTALARGIADADALAAMSDEAAASLVFAPGFSTAQSVGDLSGRGVGLDAVRAAVTALGGRVAMASEPGRGARFSIALPLNVRLARIMTVRAADETFGIPLESIVETLRLDVDRLTPVRAGRAFVWRDQPAPLLELAELLRLPAPPRQGKLNVLIVRTGDDVAGVAVDTFGKRIESPLRPMTGLLAGAPGLAGSTLMGDGRVLMVLDLPELIG